MSVDPRVMALPWRVGRSLGRTLYAQLGPEPSKADPFVGLMETPELARWVAGVHNLGLTFRLTPVDHPTSTTDPATVEAE